MLTYEEALQVVLGHSTVLSDEICAFDQSLGRILAQDLVSPIDLPSFDNSAVDGYALNPSGLQNYHLIGSLPAGSADELTLREGEACRVFTGSRLPEGTCTVVMQETVEVTEAGISLPKPALHDPHIRRKGEEIVAGQSALGRGTRVTPAAVSLIATLGLERISVVARPRIAILGTGSELVRPGTPLRPGQVYQSNTFGIQAALMALQIPGASLHHIPDDLDATVHRLEQALEDHDMLIICGGMSVGDHDYVRPALERIGVQEHLWRVKIKPGKPFYFGTGDSGKRVFGLPGNPVSALVTFFLFVRPALLKMQGLPWNSGWSRATVDHPIKGARDRDEFARGRLSGHTVALEATQGSHMLTNLAEADVLVRIPAGAEIGAGDLVDVLHLDWWPVHR